MGAVLAIVLGLGLGLCIRRLQQKGRAGRPFLPEPNNLLERSFLWAEGLGGSGPSYGRGIAGGVGLLSLGLGWMFGWPLIVTIVVLLVTAVLALVWAIAGEVWVRRHGSSVEP